MNMVIQALQMFSADPLTYVVPLVVVSGFIILYRLEKRAGLH